nr:hypothetical protein KitaXyl93_78200 [Kitasatospora sp. Xyl93]
MVVALAGVAAAAPESSRARADSAARSRRTGRVRAMGMALPGGGGRKGVARKRFGTGAGRSATVVATGPEVSSTG